MHSQMESNRLQCGARGQQILIVSRERHCGAHSADALTLGRVPMRSGGRRCCVNLSSYSRTQKHHREYSAITTAKVGETTPLAIVFANIADSVQLYETLGDYAAQVLIAKCFGLATKHVHEHHGKVIKTIGDTIMCTFPSAEQAVKATMAMQSDVSHNLLARTPDVQQSIAIRVGVHFGPCILERGDVYGNVVNVAARLTGLAKGGQIVTAHDTAAVLSEVTRLKTRHLDRVSIRGKAKQMDILEVIWETDDVTRPVDRVGDSLTSKRVYLHLRSKTKAFNLDQHMTPIVLGRGADSNVVIEDYLASREHARIECRRKRFILSDVSTNGTYVLAPNGLHYLRHEEVVLWGCGKIALGRNLEKSKTIVTFNSE